MSHLAQIDFVTRIARQAPAFFTNSRVLEVGSLDINGSVRSLFRDCDYTGVDVGNGPGVDLVCEGQLLGFPTGNFDVTISCETMEHNPFWVETTANMLRMLRPGGLFIMTCAAVGRAEHGTRRTTPNDSPLTVELGWNYYRNLTEFHFRSAIDMDLWLDDIRFEQNHRDHDLYCVGTRKSDVAVTNLNMNLRGDYGSNI